MKKLMFLAASAAMMLASCTEKMDFTQADLQNAANPSNEVQFGTYMGRTATTRAGATGAMTNTTLKGATAGFGVFAYYSGTSTMATWSSWNPTTPTASNKAPNFMYNQQVRWSTTTPTNQWNYSPVKYWPNGIDAANGGANPSNTATEAAPQYLSFFAYAPYVYQGTAAYETSNTYVGGNLPTGVTAAVYTGDAANPVAPTAVQKGIVAMSKNNEEKDMYVKYILDNATETSAVDLLWGLRGQNTYQETDNTNNTEATLGSAYNTDLTKQIVGEKVKFLFKHALSRVGGSTSSTTAGGDKQICGVWVVVDVDKNSTEPAAGQSAQTTFFSTDFNKASTLVTIEEVKIRDAYTYTVTEDAGNSITDEESDFLTDGWFDIMNGKWYETKNVKEHTTSGKGATYSVKANKDGADYALNPKIKEGTPSNTTGAAWTTSNSGGAEGVELTKKALFDDTDVPGLLLIPGTGNNTLYITVKYHVRTADPNLSTGFSHVTQEITNKVQLNGSILEPNKYYNLVMHLGLTSVKFEAVVADWASTTAGTYDEEGAETPSGTENSTSVWLPSNVVAYAVNYDVAADATSQVVNFGSYSNVGDYVNESHTGAGVSSVAYSSPNATITLTPNTTSHKVVNTVTLNGTTGKVVVTITQAAKAIEFGTPTSGTFTVSGPSDLDLTTATITITKGDTNYTHDSAASDTHFTYDNSANPKTITLPTESGTYSVTVTQNDATLTQDVTR